MEIKNMNDTDLFEMRKVIKLTLLKIGIRCDFVGFNYLSYAVELTIFDPGLLKNICRGLYFKIAEKFCVKNSACVERNIRHAITNTFNNKSFCTLNTIFNVNFYAKNDKPTIKTLIKLISEYYTMGLYKK